MTYSGEGLVGIPPPGRGGRGVGLQCPFPEVVKPIILYSVEQRGDQDLGIAEAEPLRLTEDKIYLIADLEHRGEMQEPPF